MISYIKGELAEILPDVIVVEANGIGYNIYVRVQFLVSFHQLAVRLRYIHI